MSQNTPEKNAGHGFGTTPVFLASISTILGAVLFLFFGYAVAHAGLMGTLAIVVLGHMVTIPTALAISEIATNRRVEGGGEYFIISRSFGTTIGGSIGISLYLSQAISVAFYMIAFAHAFRPLAPMIEAHIGYIIDPRVISVAALVLLALVVLIRGADLGVSALAVVSAVLGVSLVLFFLGSPVEGADGIHLNRRIEGADPLILVFAIVFPAFTGMTAGVGLSGDLKNPRRSIPMGTLAGTIIGMLVYVAIAFKLAASAPVEVLAGDHLAMGRIALWGPIIPIGLAGASLSSAIGSILVAPRTLQALSADGILPSRRLNRVLAHGVGESNEPRAATLVTVVFAGAIISLGEIDFVARIISMFFMVTYGALCTISFLEHLAARPSYRPTFRSRWYVSLLGALMCFLLMFQMDPLVAFIALVVMAAIYRGLRQLRGGSDDIADLLQGVMTQITRYFQIKLQRRAQKPAQDEWRPSLIMIEGKTFERTAPLTFFHWLCYRYGFGTYLHFIEAPLDEERCREAEDLLERLVELVQTQKSGVYVDTLISPSMRSALAQTIQLPGVSGMENNTVLFAFSRHDEPDAGFADDLALARAGRMNVLVLRHGDLFFGDRSAIHIWLGEKDAKNANLMILLAYILVGHPEWQKASIRIFAAIPRQEIAEQRSKLEEVISSGRLPISRKNLRLLEAEPDAPLAPRIESLSKDADLLILGFRREEVIAEGQAALRRPDIARDVLFVAAEQEIVIT